MLELEKAKREFDIYTKNFNFEIKSIKNKYEHSYRVMALSQKIAESLNLSKEKITIATIIGLLHDIARFEQWTKYQTFSDNKSIDHGDSGVEILENDSFIRNFIETDKYDEIIKIAIRNHNKYKIEEGLNEEEILYSKIIRDADKIDILYEASQLFWQSDEEIESIENSYVSDEYFNQFVSRIQIKKGKNQTPLDTVIVLIAFIFDINFNYSIHEIYNLDFINKILDRFNYKNEKAQRQMAEIRKVANNYLKENM